MIDAAIDVLNFSGLEEVTPEEIPGLISGINLQKVAFGLLHFPEEQKFRFSATNATDVKKIQDVQDLLALKMSDGFVTFPFSLESHPGYFIESKLSVQDVLELSLNDLHQNSSSNIGEEKLTDTTQWQYTENVKSAKDEILSGHFSKLVVGRVYSQKFDPKLVGQFLESVLLTYPRANISIFNLPQHGIWVSATPEILLSHSKSEGIRSMALAGTRPYEEDFDQISLWSSKELEEQSLVSDFIRNVFQDLGFSKVKEKGPFTVQAGNLLHLRTDFFAQEGLREDFFNIVSCLHPTSAVCGSPQEGAVQWLRQTEGFDRSFFTGFSGVLSQDTAKFVVNLRTAQILGDFIRLFAGAGITLASNPEKEWLETEEKLKTLGRFISA